MGEATGFVNRPDIGDEVIIGFLNNDLNQGVILGVLYSQKHPGSDVLAPVEENNKKGWVIKEDMHLLFDRDEDIVELVSAKGKSILVDQDTITINDENANEIIFDSSGITFSSSKDLKLKADGDLVMEAQNVDIKANIAFSAKGNTANLEGSSNNTIKGGIVQIN